MNDWRTPAPDFAAILRSVPDVDAVICRLQDHIRTLNTLRNSLVPVADLPEEILLHIFSQLAELHDLGRPAKGVSEPACQYRWITVTHVCRAWRRIALKCPALWARISFGNSEVVSAFLERSGNCSLSLWSHGENPKMTGVESVVVENAGRLASFGRLTVTPQVLENLRLPTGDPLELPLLESLYLSAAFTPFAEELAPPELGLLPRLKILDITNSTWSFARSLSRPTLTCLRISNPGLASLPANCPSTSHWCEVLQSLPSLEELCLSNMMDDIHMGVDQLRLPTHPIELRHLRAVTLRQDGPGSNKATACAHLLLHISSPPSTTITLEGRRPHSCVDCRFILLCLDLRTRLSTSTSFPTASAHNSMSVSRADTARINVPSFAVVLTGEHGGPGNSRGRLCLILTVEPLDWGHVFREGDTFIPDLCSSTIVRGVSCLEFTADSLRIGEIDTTWISLAHSRYLQLRSLVLCRPQREAFSSAMRASLAKGEDFFPLLDTLAVGGLSWRRLAYPEGSPESELVELLWERRNRGQGPSILVFEEEPQNVDELELFERYEDDWAWPRVTVMKRRRA